MLVLGGAAVFIAVRLNSQTTIIPEEAKAYSFTNYPCSGACNSGRECNSYGDPSPGTMWSCWPTNGTYRCAESAINEGGDQCWGCPGNMAPCGCDEAACNTACLAKIPASGGSATHTMLCAGCQQKFTCSCSTTITNTPTVTITTNITNTLTPTGSGTATPTITTTLTVTTTITTTITKTITPTLTNTSTPTNTPTNTPTITPTEIVTTIPETALINDEVDRILIGIGLVVLGIIFYANNLYVPIYFIIKKAVIDTPRNASIDKFQDKVQDKYKSKSKK